MIRLILLPIAFVFLFSACNRAAEDKGAVRAGLLEHLEKNSGLDIKAMDVEITSLRFESGEALATVAFKPKENPGAGMTMNYTMERKGSQWTVKGRGDSAGTGGGGMQVEPGATPGQMPPAHPPIQTQPQQSGELPAGHPPVSSPKSSKK